MGYRIEYSGGRADIKQRKERIKYGWKGWLLVLVLLSLLLEPVRKKVCSYLIPGDDAVTIQALERMVRSFREGSPVGDALEVFCREVLYEGA